MQQIKGPIFYFFLEQETTFIQNQKTLQIYDRSVTAHKTTTLLPTRDHSYGFVILNDIHELRRPIS